MRSHRVLLLVAFLLAALLWRGGTPAAAAPQATFTVNTTTDAPDAQPGNGKCETATGNDICSLRAAIMEANALAGINVIHLPAGTYTLTRVGQDATGLNGDLDITDSLGIYGVGAASTIIDGNGPVTQDRVFDIQSWATVSISDMSITRGVTPGAGGGIYNRGALTLTNTNVSFNSAHAGGGGIISVPNTLILVNSSVSGNLAEHGGGVASLGEFTLTNSTVSANRAKYDGGGIFSGGGTLSFTNSTISGNRTDGNGGGLGVFSSVVYLNNVTIASNVADDDNNDASVGGGISITNSTTDVWNTIIANNVHRNSSTPLPLPDDCHGTLNVGFYNFIESLTGCTVDGNTTHNITGQDPQLGPLQNNGGATQTHALNANSPAIDAGNSAGCKDKISVMLSTDQRGAPRHFDGDGNGSKRCDMGSVEYSGRTTYPTPTATKTPINTPPTATKTLPTATKTPTNPPPTATKTPTNPPPTVTKTPTNQPPATATPIPTSSNGCATKPNKPLLLAPPHNKTVNKVMVKLDWEDVPCATNYKVKVMQDGKDGILADKKNVTVSKHKTGTLATGHTFFWTVKACNSHGCAKSETRTFHIPAKP